MPLPIRSAAVILTLGVLTTGCSVDKGADAPSAGIVDAPGMSCDRIESFSGALQVGEPVSRRPTVVPGDRAPAPGEVPPTAVYPVLDSVDFDTRAGEDRVVFTFSGDGSIGWSARFVQIPFRRGTDVPAPVSGTCLLQVDLSSVDTGDTWTPDGPPVRLSPPGVSEIVDVLSYPGSEQLAQTFIGTRTGTPVVAVETPPDTSTLTVAIGTAPG